MTTPDAYYGWEKVGRGRWQAVCRAATAELC